MTRLSTALCSALAIHDDGAPEWLHLLPAGEVRTRDGRGPYRVCDATALMASSMMIGKLVLDENHSTDLAAPKGEPAPARGWIVELQRREDGIWGRVEWTGEGRRLAEDKSYRGVSPVIAHRKDGTITAILRASLTNQPNLTGLQSLHQEDGNMDFRTKLIEVLGLASDADDDAIIAAIKGKGDTAAALQSALSPIAVAAGLGKDADAAAVLAGVQQLVADRGDGVDSPTVKALQSELADVTQRLNDLQDSGARAKAEAFVDKAIADGTVGLKPLRADYISMHMENAERTEKLIGGMARLKGGAIVTGEPPKTGEGDLGAADNTVIGLMGLDADSYKKTLAERAQREEAL